VADRTNAEHEGGILIGRRNVLMMAAAAGALIPFVGTGTAQAAQGDGYYDIPEESGSVPWW
jgi:hypothetical protein